MVVTAAAPDEGVPPVPDAPMLRWAADCKPLYSATITSKVAPAKVSVTVVEPAGRAKADQIAVDVEPET